MPGRVDTTSIAHERLPIRRLGSIGVEWVLGNTEKEIASTRWTQTQVNEVQTGEIHQLIKKLTKTTYLF